MFIGICSRSPVSVYRTIGPLVGNFCYNLELLLFLFTLFLVNSNIKSLFLQKIQVLLIMEKIWGKNCKIAHFGKKLFINEIFN